MSLRCVFMGTPDFSVPVLERMLADGHELVAVYSQPPRPAGRGMAERKSPVHVRAEKHGLNVRTPKSLRNEDEQQAIASLGADVCVVVAYGLILPLPVLDAPRFGCLNVHASLLPRWRGAAPIQRAIMAGDDESGVAIMQMEQGLDTGPVLAEVRTPITDETTAGSLHDALSMLGAEAMSGVLARLASGDVPDATPQAQEGVTYAEKISKSEAHVNFEQPARAVLRHVHGLSPFPGAWCMLPTADGGKMRVKLHQLEPVEGVTGESGTIVDDELTIACQKGAVRPVRLQREGKGPVDLKAFLNGFQPVIGGKVA